ncbi:MAG: hypothetical protein AAGI07_18825 [Bacteroidota bacterium]
MQRLIVDTNKKGLHLNPKELAWYRHLFLHMFMTVYKFYMLHHFKQAVGNTIEIANAARLD